jgi:Peptidase family M28
VAPAVLALLFSVSPTGTLPRPTLNPLFDASVAASVAAELSTEFPSRVPGTDEAASAARWYSETISGLGLVVEEDVWRVDLVDLGDVELRNLVTVVPGRSAESIVLVAHRDNDGGGGDNASGTAALIELARGFARQGDVPAPLLERTLVFLSTDAGAYGGAGAERFARSSPLAEQAIAAIVLDGVGGRGRPRVVVAGGSSSSPARTLVSTASARIAEQVGRAPALPSVLTQLVNLGIPYAAGEQASFLARGVAAVGVTTQEPGEPSIAVGDPPGALSAEALGRLGRATEAIVGSIDTSVGATFPTRDNLFLDDRVASGWTVRLTLVVAVVPFVLGVLDLLVRSRRRRLPLVPGLRALRTRLFVWSAGGLLVWIGALTGVFPTGAALPLPPTSSFVVDWQLAGLAVLALAFVLGWLVARRPLVRSARPSPEERLAGYTSALTWLGIVAVVVALVKPYALVFVLPSLYAWLWLPLRSRFWPRVGIYVAGLLGPVAGLLLLGHELGLGPADTALYVLGLLTVGYVGVFTALLAIAWLAAAAQLAALSFGRYAPYAGGAEPPPPGPVRNTVMHLRRRIGERG